MDFTHYNLVRIERSAVIEVTLRGSAANESLGLTDRQCDIHRQQTLAMSQPFGRDNVEMSGGENKLKHSSPTVNQLTANLQYIVLNSD